MTRTETVWLSYIIGNREEQIGDNEGSVDSQNTPIGVNYHVYRKAIAQYLYQNLYQHSTLSNVHLLNREALTFYTTLLNTGIWPSTIKQWLYKYQGFSGNINKNLSSEGIEEMEAINEPT